MATFRRIYETTGYTLEHLDVAKLEACKAVGDGWNPPKETHYDDFIFGNLVCRDPEADYFDQKDDELLGITTEDHHRYLPYIPVMQRRSGEIVEVNRIYVHYIPVTLDDDEKVAPCVATGTDVTPTIEVLGDPGSGEMTDFIGNFKTGKVTIEDYFALMEDDD